jgi:DNA-binding NarL/FixJ family response regulator
MHIRIVLIDDFPLIRDGFAAALESDPGLEVVGCAESGEKGLALVREQQPDEYSRASRGEASDVRPLLGEREHDVLRLVAAGATDKEIAQKLYISPRTVQNHLTRIRDKTGLRRRAELTRWAMEHTLT